MSERGIALYDPDGWREWWASLHRSETCDPQLAVFAKECLEDPLLPEGVGSKILDVDDGDGRVDVEICTPSRIIQREGSSTSSRHGSGDAEHDARSGRSRHRKLPRGAR